MRPLNPSDVIWLVGDPSEISEFLNHEQVSEKGIFLGHPENSVDYLRSHITAGPLGRELERYIRTAKKPQICFLLLEGRVVGLIREEPKSEPEPKARGPIDLQIFEEIAKGDAEGIVLESDYIAALMKDRKLSEADARKAITLLIKEGWLYETKPGKLRKAV